MVRYIVNDRHDEGMKEKAMVTGVMLTLIVLTGPELISGITIWTNQIVVEFEEFQIVLEEIGVNLILCLLLLKLP